MPTVLEGLSPWFVNKRLDPRDMRAGLAAAFAGGYDTTPGNLTGEAGVLPGGGGSNGQLGVVALDQPGMGVQVIAGQCVIPVAGELGYVGTLPTSGTLDIAPADQTNPRIDLIVARVVDSAEGTGDRKFTVEVVQGVASATPSEPSLSGMNCVVVSAVRVKASATSITVFLRRCPWRRAGERQDLRHRVQQRTCGCRVACAGRRQQRPLIQHQPRRAQRLRRRVPGRLQAPVGRPQRHRRPRARPGRIPPATGTRSTSGLSGTTTASTVAQSRAVRRCGASDAGCPTSSPRGCTRSFPPPGPRRSPG
ncbi:hypothetical protein [Saccharopolyspora sp. ASAGF58]|uniref:hypothetical protein n=1 Tax=Saccharopolyspora sp. ASAGF58 TaxID=2719023 RepID=UPI00144748F7|nr:hypothetical protein [Saccharopolyspora sp. ASAGF58]